MGASTGQNARAFLSAASMLSAISIALLYKTGLSLRVADAGLFRGVGRKRSSREGPPPGSRRNGNAGRTSVELHHSARYFLDLPRLGHACGSETAPR